MRQRCVHQPSEGWPDNQEVKRQSGCAVSGIQGQVHWYANHRPRSLHLFHSRTLCLLAAAKHILRGKSQGTNPFDWFDPVTSA